MGTRKKSFQDFCGNPPAKINSDSFYGYHLDEEQTNLANAIWDRNIDIVMVNSRAGTGKTFVATGVANMLVQYGFYDSIVYIMSPYGERRQGWLPGTITEKSSVYFEPFYQALVKCNVNLNTSINTETMVNQKNGTGYITCITDTFVRGDTIENAVVILDESQNYTIKQLKTILTRVSDSTKVIMIGHELQCDLEDPSKSGFTAYINHFKGMERAAYCELKHNHRGWISTHADNLVTNGLYKNGLIVEYQNGDKIFINDKENKEEIDMSADTLVKINKKIEDAPSIRNAEDELFSESSDDKSER